MTDSELPDREAYNNIKDHFLTKFAQLDEHLPGFDARSAQNLLTEFIQEGIGALLAYLPQQVARDTLSDFMIVLKMGKVTDKSRDP